MGVEISVGMDYRENDIHTTSLDLRQNEGKDGLFNEGG